MLRKEFSQARMLSIAQAQFLRAHDEIKMSTSRLRLKESEDEPSEVNILAREELVQLNMQFSSDKFLALPALHRIKGQLRYLKVVYCFCLITFCFIFFLFFLLDNCLGQKFLFFFSLQGMDLDKIRTSFLLNPREFLMLSFTFQ